MASRALRMAGLQVFDADAKDGDVVRIDSRGLVHTGRGGGVTPGRPRCAVCRIPRLNLLDHKRRGIHGMIFCAFIPTRAKTDSSCLGKAVRLAAGRKQFFFEKKNQKTFDPNRRALPQRAYQWIKVFCFFSSEKKGFLAAGRSNLTPLGIRLGLAGNREGQQFFLKEEAKPFNNLARALRQRARRIFKSFLVLFFKKELFLLPALILAAATPAPNEQILHLSGNPDRAISLVVTLFLPPGEGKFPLAVINHPSLPGKSPGDTPRYRATAAAAYFLSRGYAVALPMMRGFGGSPGQQANHGCDFDEVALDNGRDAAGIITGLAADRHIDTSRVVVAGEGFGGWTTLGLAALNPPGVAGIINVNGGIQSNGCAAAQGGGQAALMNAVRRLGAATTVPSLWLYSRNDPQFPPKIWHRLLLVYQRAGGKARLADAIPAKDANGLAQKSDFASLVPQLDGFLGSIGLPNHELYPAFAAAGSPDMARPALPATHFAALDDVAAVPLITEPGRAAYRNFLAAPLPRVFVIAENGQSASAHGGVDPLGRAQKLCHDHGLVCVPYAIDNDVVWAGAPTMKAPPATHFAALNDVKAVPWVNDRSRDAYAAFLTLGKPRAFVVATSGQSVTSQGGYDPLSRALAICRKAGLTCRAYAVNDQVVFEK